MHDSEKIAILRKRILELETAFETFLDAMEQTGKERMAALAPVVPLLEEAPLPDQIVHFFQVYKETTRKRVPAITALYEVLRTDFVTALVSDPDFTKEQEEYWLRLASESGTP